MKRSFVLLIMLALLFSLFSCREPDEDNVDYVEPPKEVTYLGDAVKLPEYKGLTVIRGINESRGDAIWSVVLDGSEVTEYPASFLSYYKSQTLTKYKILASEADMSYLELLENLGLTEDDVEAEARALAKSELVMMALIEKEGIVLTEDEKVRLFDRYAEKLAEKIGKEVSYVKEKHADDVLDTMLRDKMIEFLITQNTFVPEE